jgi:hypothetical protein
MICLRARKTMNGNLRKWGHKNESVLKDLFEAEQ